MIRFYEYWKDPKWLIIRSFLIQPYAATKVFFTFRKIFDYGDTGTL